MKVIVIYAPLTTYGVNKLDVKKVVSKSFGFIIMENVFCLVAPLACQKG